MEYGAGIPAHVSLRRRKRTVGCVVSKEGRVVSVGFNGFAPGSTKLDRPSSGDSKHDVVSHAEQNAALYGPKDGLRGAMVYTTLFPCDECLPFLVSSGVRTIITTPYKVKGEGERLTYFRLVPKILERKTKPVDIHVAM
eukprot:m.253537 g.253537  ORF g.253537 m.253537 type:complete len:139 (+) comp15932_c0_seq3:2440-2856(+)